jgi:uncharacterized protein
MHLEDFPVTTKKTSRLRFNFGFLLEANLGTSRTIELDYPSILLEDEVTLEPLTGSFQAIRNSKGIYITGQLNSKTETECARCLTPVLLPIQIELDDLFYHPAHEAPEGEFAVGEDGFIDLAPLVRELSLLELPMQHFCREDCKGLCPNCGKNLNEGACECPADDTDPRLSILRDLLDAQQ